MLSCRFSSPLHLEGYVLVFSFPTQYLTGIPGIFPREPRSRKKANKGSSAPTSFYYTKDIAYLAHEPILKKLREHKAFAKKLSRALGRGEWSSAKNLEENKPIYRLDHIIKERRVFPQGNYDLRLSKSLQVFHLHRRPPRYRRCPVYGFSIFVPSIQLSPSTRARRKLCSSRGRMATLCHAFSGSPQSLFVHQGGLLSG
jgi:hypothetical protein